MITSNTYIRFLDVSAFMFKIYSAEIAEENELGTHICERSMLVDGIPLFAEPIYRDAGQT
jgi:hypothetical protein